MHSVLDTRQTRGSGNFYLIIARRWGGGLADLVDSGMTLRRLSRHRQCEKTTHYSCKSPFSFLQASPLNHRSEGACCDSCLPRLLRCLPQDYTLPSLQHESLDASRHIHSYKRVSSTKLIRAPLLSHFAGTVIAKQHALHSDRIDSPRIHRTAKYRKTGNG